MLEGRRIVVGVGGSVSAYKSAHLVRELLRRGAQVRAILTAAGGRFIGPALLRALTGQEVATDLFAPGAPEHVALAAWAEAAVVAPATADVIAKAAAGIADDYLSTWLLAFPGPVLFCPAMNRHMWSHPAVRRNLRILAADGAAVLPPGHGALGAPGEGEGWGRLPEAPAVADALAALVSGGAPARRAELAPPSRATLAGRRIVVTAGPTREAIDPFRFLSNPSSGRMGYALAEAARDRGASAVLVSGPAALPDPDGVRLIRVGSALEMRAALLGAVAEGADAVIGAAAVSDFRPDEVSAVKIKRSAAGAGGGLTLRLVPNPDLIAEIGRGRLAPVVVGFAAEAGAGPEEAERKLADKGLDLCVYNDLRAADSGFEVETDRAVIVDRAGVRQDMGLLSKRALAECILDRVEALLPAAPPAGGGA